MTSRGRTHAVLPSHNVPVETVLSKPSGFPMAMATCEGGGAGGGAYDRLNATFKRTCSAFGGTAMTITEKREARDKTNG